MSESIKEFKKQFEDVLDKLEIESNIRSTLVLEDYKKIFVLHTSMIINIHFKIIVYFLVCGY